MSRRQPFILLLAALVVLVVALSADAYRRPVLFSVLNDGLGLPTLPNDVMGFSPDGAFVFLSSGFIWGRWPDGTNVFVVPPAAIGLLDNEEIDALSYGYDLVLHPDEVQAGAPIEFYFSVDRGALGVAGVWPPEVFTEVPRAAGDIYFAWPIFWPYGGNHLGVPEVILGLDTMQPDDLDAMTFMEEGQVEPGIPVYFSVDRVTCGVPPTATWMECNNPAPPEQAADVFFSFLDGMNLLFADEAMMGLDGNDDNIDAMALIDRSQAGGPNYEVDPGLDWIYFSVDWMTTGLQGTAVYNESQSGNIQGDIFFSDFTGMNWKVLDGRQLGLLEPMPPLPFTPDEDNLNALETEEWWDRDADNIPDIVDNCPDDPNPLQLDGDLNGIGDICDPTGAEMGLETREPVDFALHEAEPNPFRPGTKLSFSLPQAAHVTLEIFSVDGRRVSTLANRHFEAGTHSLVWDATDLDGASVAAGVYFATLRAGEQTATRKLVRLE